jgi:Domain of unknown function (DUF4272)
MATEPVTLFARIADPAGIARRLRELVPDVQIDGPDDNWRKAVVTFRRWLKKSTLTINHDPDYYSEPNWSNQMSGMRGFLSRFPDSDAKTKALWLTTTFKFSLGNEFDPEVRKDDDPRLPVLFAMTELVDGVLFRPSSMVDARGRVLFGFGGMEEDPEAVWPRVIGEATRDDPIGAAAHEESRPLPPGEDRAGADPPDADRVARRALALTAVTVRAILEQDGASRSSSETHKKLLDWIRDLGIDDELEPDEWEVVQRKPGKLGSQMQINSTWRLEGLVVLAWALKRFDIPPHDQLVEVNPLWDSLGWPDADTALCLLESPDLRSRAEIGTLRNRLLPIHWRIRNYGIRPSAFDFAEHARTCDWGPLDITDLPLVDGDLSIRGKRLDRADSEAVGIAHSAAMERHKAANWLRDGPKQYSLASEAT